MPPFNRSEVTAGMRANERSRYLPRLHGLFLCPLWSFHPFPVAFLRFLTTLITSCHSRWYRNIIWRFFPIQRYINCVDPISRTQTIWQKRQRLQIHGYARRGPLKSKIPLRAGALIIRSRGFVYFDRCAWFLLTNCSHGQLKIIFQRLIIGSGEQYILNYS